MIEGYRPQAELFMKLILYFIKMFFYITITQHEKCPNTELFLVRIQSECGKIRTRNNPVFEHFSRSIRS